MSEKELTVRGWVDDLCKRGIVCFTMHEVEKRFWYMPSKAIRSSIYRMVKKGRVYSAWRGFYAIVPEAHALKGFLPPIEYIGSLMEYLGHRYYVGLTSAAVMHDAGETPPRELTVVTESNDIRTAGSEDFLFFAKSKIPEPYLREVRTEYGKVLVSSPELTAADLLLYEDRIGGPDTAAEFIGRLSLDFAFVGDDYWRIFRAPVIQRLGFVIEVMLGDEDTGESIYSRAKAAGVNFRRTLLSPKNITSHNDGVAGIDDRWKIVY